LGALLQGHIANRLKDVSEALGRIEEKSELIYKMDALMPLFYARQGITQGSVFDLIIQDKMRRDASLKIVTGILLALVAIALTVLSLGTAAPAIVTVGATMAALGLSTYMAYEQYQEYTEDNDLADVGLADEPSVVWLVLSVVGVVLDSAAAVKAIRALAPAARVLNEGGQLAEFNKVVEALKESGEIDAKIARSVQKAAAARQGFSESASELTKLLSGKLYSFPAPFTDPDLFRLLVRMAKAKIQEGVHSAQIFLDELKKARLLAKLGDMTPEELAKAKEAWEQALHLAKSEEKAVDLVNPKSGRLVDPHPIDSHVDEVANGLNKAEDATKGLGAADESIEALEAWQQSRERSVRNPAYGILQLPGHRRWREGLGRRDRAAEPVSARGKVRWYSGQKSLHRRITMLPICSRKNRRPGRRRVSSLCSSPQGSIHTKLPSRSSKNCLPNMGFRGK
jgi:hypothetical protein